MSRSVSAGKDAVVLAVVSNPQSIRHLNTTPCCEDHVSISCNITGPKHPYPLPTRDMHIPSNPTSAKIANTITFVISKLRLTARC